MRKRKSHINSCMASSQLHSVKPGRALTQDASERTMEQYLIEQYLARIGYASDLNPGPDIKAATIEDVQSKILNQLKVQQRPARMPDLHEGIPLNTRSTNSTPRPEASHHTFVHGYESELPSPPPTPPPPKETEFLQHSRLSSSTARKSVRGSSIRSRLAKRKSGLTHPSRRRSRRSMRSGWRS